MATIKIDLKCKTNWYAFAVAWILVKLYTKFKKLTLLKVYHNQYPIAKVTLGDVLKLRFKSDLEVQATEYRIHTQNKE